MDDALRNRLASIQANAAMCPQHVASVTNVPQQTVAQWIDGTESPNSSTEKFLLELELLVDRLSRIYKPHEARTWLFTRQSLLGDRVPAELIRQGQVHEVQASVNQLLDGAYL